MMRDAGFDEVTEAVQLVLDLQVHQALTGKVDLVVGVEVTVRLLNHFELMTS